MSEISGTHIYIEEAGSTLTCSSQSVWSVNGHAMITPCDGIISPPGFRYMSRALTKLSSMRSCTSRKPMGSDTMMSTLPSTLVSSTAHSSTSITLSMLFPLMSSRAHAAISLAISTA